MIRESYLNGASAAVLAARFDVTEGAIRKRIIREGWSKQAGAAAGPAAPAALGPVFPTVGSKPVYSARDAAKEAVAASYRCMSAGRLDDAAAFARIAETLSRAARAAGEGPRFPVVIKPRPPSPQP